MRLDHHPGREGRAAEIPDLAGVHQVTEGRQCVVDIGAGAGPVDLVEVDIVRAQPAQAGLALGDYPAPRIALAVAVFAHLAVELSWPTRCPGVGRTDRAKEIAHDFFGFTGRINVGGIDKIDARVEGTSGLCGGTLRGQYFPRRRTSWRPSTGN